MPKTSREDWEESELDIFFTENSVFYCIIAYLMCPVFTLIDFNVLTINNNNKIYLHDYNKVLQYCKSYLNLIINSL